MIIALTPLAHWLDSTFLIEDGKLLGQRFLKIR